MASYKLLFVFFVFTNFLNSATAETPVYIYRCITNKNFTDKSAFQENLKDLIGFLSSNATGKTEFYNITVADATDADTRDPSDTVYGLFMCSNNIAPQLCHQCVSHAANRLAFDYCAYMKEAIIWYGKCMVRYSNRSFFSAVDTRPKFVVFNSANVDSDQSTFSSLLFNTMNAIADEAAKPTVGEKKYATKQVNISRSQSLYCLAQCTPDLSPKDCKSCLSLAIGEFSCCTEKQGGRVLYPSCDVRYELYPFYPSATVVVTPAPTNSSEPQGKGKGQSQRTIVVIVLFIVVACILICFGCSFLWSKTRKSYKPAVRENYFGSDTASLARVFAIQFGYN